jgi:hypothetical protein
MACVRALLAVIGAMVCVGAGAAKASDSGSGRVYEMRLSSDCFGARKPPVAPHVLGALAQVTLPAAWHTLRVPAPSGGSCEQPYLLTDRRGDAGLCVEETVYATASRAGAGTVTLAERVGEGGVVIARGALPTVSGVRGIWEELNTGALPTKYPAYQVDAVYEAADHRLFYELMVVPPPSYPGVCRGGGPVARAVARAIAGSFRVRVTDRGTAQTLSR